MKLITHSTIGTTTRVLINESFTMDNSRVNSLPGRGNTGSFVADGLEILGRFDQVIGAVRRGSIGEAGRYERQDELLVD